MSKLCDFYRLSSETRSHWKCATCGHVTEIALIGEPVRECVEVQKAGGDDTLPSWLTCPWRGRVSKTVSGRKVGCGCGELVFHECRRFRELVNLKCSDRDLAKLKTRVEGFKGRTCRECDVPMLSKPAAKPPVKAVEFGRFDPAKHLESFPYHPVSQRIAAVTCHFNPHNSESRRRCFATFAKQFPKIGMELFCAEGSVDDRWEIPGAWQLAMDSETHLFAKENLLNLAFNRLPDQYDRVLWIDADVLMLPRDYVDRLESELDKHPVAHAFSEIMYLGPEGQPQSNWRGSLGLLNSRLDVPTSEPSKGYPGLAWAARRETLQAIGGLYDRMITGGGDVAWCIGAWREMRPRHLTMWPEPLLADLDRWAQVAHQHITSVGFAPARGYHLYHGRLNNRQYVTRNEALRKVQFDPQKHLEYAPNGTLRWSREAPELLRRAVREYIHGRKEDER